MLVPVLLGDGVAADLADASVETRTIELLDLLAALLADLLVEIRAVALRGRTSALLPDLLIELRTMTLSCGGATAASGFGDGIAAINRRADVIIALVQGIKGDTGNILALVSSIGASARSIDNKASSIPRLP